MSDELEKIRAEKMAALNEKINAVEEQFEDIQSMKKEFTWADFGFDEPIWGFRESTEMAGAFDVCQQGETVAITGDPRWAMLVCDLLNRAKMEELIMQEGAEKNE